MRLTAPIYRLKRDAHRLARTKGIALHAALDAIARTEGYARWSELVAKQPAPNPASQLEQVLAPGELLLLAARPGQGKTMLALEAMVHAIRRGQQGLFFTLDWTERDLNDALRVLAVDPATLGGRLSCETSDDICAKFMIERLRGAAPGTLAVVDYLQLLDQRRETPPVSEQLAALGQFAAASGVRFIVLSQVDRRFDPALRPLPGPDDVRRPNPVDLSLFARACYLHDGALRIDRAA